ncbi:MAG: D-alanine--D-alanine ligase [Propionibacteriaceae bacterium]|nr:D-alanine--D-alanine ligase [Propionibacteriaceae bacterium]
MSESLAMGGGHRTGTRPRVAVIFGGTSGEHGVSCLTAVGVFRAIDTERYDVVGIGITRSGRWVIADGAVIAGLQVHDGRLPELDEAAVDAILVRSATGSDLAVRRQSALAQLGPVDLGFSLLHGPFGEDGTIQGLFEMMGTRYVGAGVLASAVGMDKHFMKLVFSASGLPIGPFVTITPRELARDKAACLDAVSALTYPLFVKPARGGSSLGISKVTDPSGLEEAITFAQGYDPKVVVEQGFVGARELECGVLGGVAGGSPVASEVAEIRVHTESGFYDFEAKYLPEEQVDLDVPANVAPDIAEQVRAWAVRAFDAIGCEGLARVDFFVTRDLKVFVNEINTMPGFTEHSMFPRMWSSSGMGYPELVDRLIQLGLQRPLGLR